MGLIVYTGGTFDLPHAGHVNFLKSSAALGTVVVALNTDEFIAEYKGKPPIMSYQERKAVLEEFKCVDRVIPNIGGTDSKPAIEMVNPDYITIGTDWQKKDYYAQMSFTKEWLQARDIKLVYVPYFETISTTEIKRRLAVK